MELLLSSLVYTILCLIVICICSAKLFAKKVLPKDVKLAPSPKSLPIIGHLHLLAKFPEEPWKGFDLIRQNFGDIVSLRLGMYDTIMVSSLESMKEVLLYKGKIFSDRPHFYRYQLIFGGDQENALALCDWSSLQKVRRALCSISTTPKFSSSSYNMLDKALSLETRDFIKFIENSENRILTKCWARQFSSNAFTRYLCDQRLEYDDDQLKKQSYNYDFIFYDISQCSAIDFLPFLRYLGVGRKYLKQVYTVSEELREFVEKVLVNPRIEKLTKESESFNEIKLNEDDNLISLDLLFKYHCQHPDEYSYEHFLFTIGDLVGGSSAIVNMIMRILGHLAIDKNIQDDIFQEASSVAAQSETDLISLKHRASMPLMEAAIMEALRISSSPLVPHVPTSDTTLGGYFVPKGTMILFNNYHLNFSEKYYQEPYKFQPYRFLTRSPENNNSSTKWIIKKPEIFMPFSIGQRSCLGFRLTNYTTFVALANIVLHYEIKPVEPIETIEKHIASGMLALKVDDCFSVQLVPRNLSKSY